MKATEIQARRQQILSLLSFHQKMNVTALVAALHVSDETVRKDLAVLADQGAIHKTFGAAELIKVAPTTPVGQRSNVANMEKDAIARTALKLIDDSMHTIGLDQGTTVAALAAQLTNLTDKTLFTRSLPALIALKDGTNQFYSPGGYYSPTDMAFQSTQDTTFDQIHLDISFFGTSGVKNRDGTCSTSFTDVGYKQAMHQNSAQTVALLDHTKFTQTSLVEVLPWSAFDTVITDARTSAETIVALRQQTHVIVAPV